MFAAEAKKMLSESAALADAALTLSMVEGFVKVIETHFEKSGSENDNELKNQIV